ncbi:MULTISPECIES: energy-coupling factor ABC transporter ATP-binding protein [Haloferax]|uniref:ATP-binding cassette domain-containing protein n=1 Tax=Haloferax marinum TaxID=2666143 RepID=A0A6A8G5M6_9EURY|nr:MULTISPECIES: ABC transporter ATP-binding protein [Haloferax]KAB1197515.1 ABC transporter ATP-binding protein [Haloferax sp. CBA1150]MRW96560.1 ATP-binding cassette domain-containing protein [Haloferax marinum]
MIQVDELVHRYGDTVAVDGVDLTIDDGECVVIAGANGSGKTTLVRHFDGLLEPDDGSVSVDGIDVSENLVAARTAVAMVFQHPEDQLVAATVGADVAFGPENLGLSHEEIDTRVRESLAAVDLDGREDDRVDSLSGGEVERLAIAGALAMHPAHLVLDEPFTGLDEPSRQSVLARLRDLRASGTSLVVVTHDLRDVAELADRVVVLSEGQIALDDTPESAADRLSDLGIRPPPSC